MRRQEGRLCRSSPLAALGATLVVMTVLGAALRIGPPQGAYGCTATPDTIQWAEVQKIDNSSITLKCGETLVGTPIPPGTKRIRIQIQNNQIVRYW